MTDWNFNMTEAHTDGRMVMILEHHGFSDQYSSAAVYWSASETYQGGPFGWTYDGGDRFDPIAWAPITDPEGNPIYP